MCVVMHNMIANQLSCIATNHFRTLVQAHLEMPFCFHTSTMKEGPKTMFNGMCETGWCWCYVFPWRAFLGTGDRNSPGTSFPSCNEVLHTSCVCAHQAAASRESAGTMPEEKVATIQRITGDVVISECY